MTIRMIITGFCVLVSGTAAGQGDFDFDEIPGVDQGPMVAVDIGETMIGFVREGLRGFDPAAADLLQGLRGIRVRVYSASENVRAFNDFIDDVTEELEDASWQRVMMVQDDSSTARIHMRMSGQEVSGMTVMLIDGAEAVFINIDGTITPEDLGRVMAMFNHGDVLGLMPFGARPGRGPAPDPAPAADDQED